MESHPFNFCLPRRQDHRARRCVIAAVGIAAALVALRTQAATQSLQIEGESMQLRPADQARIVNDRSASGGEALLLTRSAPADPVSKQIELSFSPRGLKFRYKSLACGNAWPKARVRIDNRTLLTSTVLAEAQWTTVYQTLRGDYAPGRHRLEILSDSVSCAGFYVDFITLSGDAHTPSPPELPVSSTCPNRAAGECRPYDPRSPWNTKIPVNAPLHPRSSELIRAVSDNGLPLTSDPTQYTIPIYLFNPSTRRVSVKLHGYFSTYDINDSDRVGHGDAPLINNVPIPDSAVAGAGSDGQITLWDPVEGTEYAFWQLSRDASGNYSASNGWRYHTRPGFHGRFANGLSGRGAGMSYFAGLVRPWEIRQGRIDHALAFAYKAPSPEFVYPASKSDGAKFGGVRGVDIPEGARLQLDPRYTDADFNAWGLSRQGKIIAKALQDYGMYVVDNSGSSKIYVEYEGTAHWNGLIKRDTVSGIPWSAFRVVAAPPMPTQ